MVTKTGFVIFPLCSLLLGKTTLSDQNYCIWRKHVWGAFVTLAEYLWNGYAIDLFSLPCLTKWVPMLDTNAARPVPLISCSGYRLTRLHRYSPYNWKCGSDGGSAISVMIRLIRTSCSWLIASMQGRTNKPVMWQERRHKMWPELYHCSWNSTIVWLYINQIYKYTTMGVVLTHPRVLMDEQTVHIEYAAQAPMISQLPLYQVAGNILIQKMRPVVPVITSKASLQCAIVCVSLWIAVDMEIIPLRVQDLHEACSPSLRRRLISSAWSSHSCES